MDKVILTLYPPELCLLGEGFNKRLTCCFSEKCLLLTGSIIKSPKITEETHYIWQILKYSSLSQTKWMSVRKMKNNNKSWRCIRTVDLYLQERVFLIYLICEPQSKVQVSHRLLCHSLCLQNHPKIKIHYLACTTVTNTCFFGIMT